MEKQEEFNFESFKKDSIAGLYLGKKDDRQWRSSRFYDG